MTLQQLQYIVAVDKHRHFVRAAEACGVTQSTLSAMIKSLETELDVTIFDRTAHPVVPTSIGEKIISQAKVVLFNAGQIEEISLSERGITSGTINLGIIPTIAPYLLPRMFLEFGNYPNIKLNVSERQTSAIIERLKRAELDMAILATPLNEPELIEIPVYYEKFFAYVSPIDSLYSEEEISPDKLPGINFWLLQEGHCFRNQIINICNKSTVHSAVYEAGSIDTLIKVIDINGGHTIIPELHIPLLTEEQKRNVRNLKNGDSVREISIVIRNDYVRESMLNIVSDVIKKIIPEAMLDARLKKYAIRI